MYGATVKLFAQRHGALLDEPATSLQRLLGPRVGGHDNVLDILMEERFHLLHIVVGVYGVIQDNQNVEILPWPK
jgi:hypothetical protein